MTKANYSYSRVAQYESCPFAYDLKYNQKKFFNTDNLTTFLGTLIHHIEESISRSLMSGKSPNYKALIEELYEVNIPKKNPFDRTGGIYGIKELQKRFPQEFFSPSDKTGLSYLAKIQFYEQNIQHQEKFLLQNPELEIFDVEHPFSFEMYGETVKGFIDRILKYKGCSQYQIHDIKTRDRLFDKTEVTTPLQHVIYSLGLADELGLEEPPTECFYDLVFIGEMQPAGTKGFIKRGYSKIGKLFDGIHSGEYAPKPSPLCHWCCFSNTNPSAPEEGRFLCPYYSKWTPDNKVYEVANAWSGGENTAILIEKVKKQDEEDGYPKSPYFVL